jgi:hypothetical protein
MTKFKALVTGHWPQYRVYTSLSLLVIIFTGILYFSDPLLFHRFIGGIDPLLAFFIVIILGALLLSFLLSHGWFNIYKKENLKGVVRRSVIAILFVFITILVDIKNPFPANINILFPRSLLFYPAIGFLVEIIFHILPLSLLLFILPAIFKDINQKNIVVVSILIVSLLEPGFQAIPMTTSNHFPLWAVAVIWLNLFVFNFFQLLLFKRYDFITMYSCRLAYYLAWHIVWGYFRLDLLF